MFERIAERKIEEAIAEGAFDNLRGRGKPLNASDLETPLDIRILKNAGIAPEWIQVSKEIESLREECRNLFERTGREYQRRRERAESPSDSSAEREQRIESFLQWLAKSRDNYLRSLKRVNSEILKINIQAPGGGQVLFSCPIEKEMERFDSAYPCPVGSTLPAIAGDQERVSNLRDSMRMLYRCDIEEQEKE